LSTTGTARAHASVRISHVAKSTLLIASFFAVDKGLGLFRQIVIGRQFGVGPALDVFNAANNLPDLLFALISGGALSIAFIPILSGALKQEGREALWALFSRVANLAFLITASLAVVIALFSKSLVRAQLGIAPGFSPEMQNLVADLMRLNLLATLLFSLSGLISAGLQSNQHFLLPAMAPVVYDLGQIFGALVLAPEQAYQLAGYRLPAFGFGIHGLVYGVILGAALHFGVQIPGLIRYRFRWAPRLGWDDPGVRRVARLMGPRILTIGAFQLTFVVQDNLASRLDPGSITALAYGWQVMQLPETLIGTALGIAILPTLAEHFAAGDNRGFESSLTRALRAMLGLAIPSMVLLMIPLRPLVQAAFRFDPLGTEQVVWAARAYLLGLLGHTVIELGARGFYARQDARTPLLASAINSISFIILSLLLFRALGASGIGLSNSAAFSIEAGVLIALLAKQFPRILRQGKSLARVGLGTGLAGLVCWAILTLSPLPSLYSALLSISLGALAALPFLRPELRDLIRI
jgi:putative peptidoglycan lipid II flippase